MTNSRFSVEADEPAAFEYVTRFFKLNRTENQTGIVLRKDGDVIAAALYVDFNGRNVFVHLAGKPGTRWLNRSFLYWGFHYPFEQLRCTRLTCWVEEDNTASRKFVEHIGWKHEATLEGAGGKGQNALIYKMLREDCKYV